MDLKPKIRRVIGKSTRKRSQRAPKVLRTPVCELEEVEAEKLINEYLEEIAESRKRSNKIQVEIERLKKKTQTIIDSL